MSTPEEERAYWDAQASSGAIAADESAWSGEQLERSLALIEPALELSLARWNAEPKRTMPMVLDLGCGIGRLLIPLARKYPDVLFAGLDVSPELTRMGRERAGGLDNTAFLWGDGRNLRVLGGTTRRFKLYGAYSMIAMQHMPREAQAGYIRQIGERLVQGGVFRFQVREGVSETFLNHYVTEEWIYDTAKSAGLRVTAYDRIPAFNDPSIVCPWVTLVKP